MAASSKPERVKQAMITQGARRGRMKLVYLTADLTDPVCYRRVRMLREGFSDIALLGFRRSAEPVASIEGIAVTELGRVEAGRLLQRSGSVAAMMLTLNRHRSAFAGASVILARNLDMLVLAALARRHYAPSASLVFECLDLHCAMTSRTPIGVAVRQLERLLLRSCDRLVVSSPDYLTGYFGQVHGRLPRTLVVENKVLEAEIVASATPVPLQPGPPWRVGWCGQMRCRESIHLLARLVRLLEGRIEVVLRGAVLPQAVPDFLDVIESTPGMHYGGPYDRRTELPAVYADLHFTWAIDFFGSHGNSQNLLPNRLYETGLYGVVPIADRSVATGRWLARHGAGILFEDPIEETAIRFFKTLDAEVFTRAKRKWAQVPRSAFVSSIEECCLVCAALAEPPTRFIRTDWAANRCHAREADRNA